MAVRPPPRKPPPAPPKRRKLEAAETVASPPTPSGPRRGGAAAAPTSRRKPEPPEPREEIPSVKIDDVLDGKYRLLEQLDEGGMGAVYVAHNEALDVPVAVKVIRADLTGQAKAKLGDRLLQEARAAARLGHPAIVRAMDFGTAPNGDPYMVMELLDGEDLASGLDQRGRVSPTKAVRIALPIIHALATAHDKGIVHRDLKPENVILCQTETGQVQPKLIDFGIAKLQRPRSQRITMMGDTLGTPEYMSPEQARGEDVDALTDVWAMCVMLYEMVTDVLPFQANNYHALLRSIIEDEALPITALGVQNDKLSAIVQRGLAKDKQDRWPSMRALGTALATWLAELGINEDICGTSLKVAWLQVPRYEGLDVLSSIPPPAARQDPAAPVSRADGVLSERSPAIEISPASAPAPSEAATPPPAETSSPPSSERALEPPVSSKAPADETSADVVVEAAATPPAPAPARRSWLLVALWALTLTGVAWAVTGYLQLPLPGLPARVELPSSVADLLGLTPSPAAPPPAAPPAPAEATPQTAAGAEPSAAPETTAAPEADAAAPAADASSTATADAATPTATAPVPVRRPTPRLKPPTFD